MVGGTGEGHGEEHRVEAGKPVGIEVRKGVLHQTREHAVAGIEEHVAGDQGDAGVDHGGHIAHAQDLGALNVEILGEQH